MIQFVHIQVYMHTFVQLCMLTIMHNDTIGNIEVTNPGCRSQYPRYGEDRGRKWDGFQEEG